VSWSGSDDVMVMVMGDCEMMILAGRLLRWMTDQYIWPI